MVKEFKETSQDQKKEKLKGNVEEAIKGMQENLHFQEPPTSMVIQENPPVTKISVNPTQEDVSADTSSMDVSKRSAEI